MPGKFVVQKGSTGKFRFNLISTNGQVVATSQTYETKTSCLNGVKSVRRLAADAALEDQTTAEWAEQAKEAKAAAAKKAAKKRAAAKKKAASSG